MNSHQNARLTAQGRARLIKRIGEIGIVAAAAESGVLVRTAYKWRARFEREGPAGLRDRSSRPRRTRSALSAQARARVLALRARRDPIRAIAASLGHPYATVQPLAIAIEAGLAVQLPLVLLVLPVLLAVTQRTVPAAPFRANRDV